MEDKLLLNKVASTLYQDKYSVPPWQKQKSRAQNLTYFWRIEGRLQYPSLDEKNKNEIELFGIFEDEFYQPDLGLSVVESFNPESIATLH